MPRMARKSLETSFFHIMVQGMNKEYIFNSRNDKDKYLYIINKYKDEYNVELLSYCIMDNHAHLLIYTEQTSDMSKFMHSVNCSYSVYYNKINDRVGYVFRDRYKSEPIYKENYLLKCINYIHMNPVKAGIVRDAKEYNYSSCNQYIKNEGIAKSKILSDTLGIDDYSEVFEYMSSNQYFMDIDIDENEKIVFLIQEYQKVKKVNLDNIKNDKELIKDLIMFLHDENNIKYTDITKALKISKTKIFRIKN